MGKLFRRNTDHFLPVFLVDSVRIWLILDQNFLGRLVPEGSNVSG
jgi:hypothetical protein